MQGLDSFSYASGRNPVSFMANIHRAAATQNFLSLEDHSVDIPWWENMVVMTDGKKIIENGYASVPLTSAGLGIELNEEVLNEEFNNSDSTFFAPTKEWETKRSHYRT